jgi:transcriptional regulator with XRE-family HTH domain
VKTRKTDDPRTREIQRALGRALGILRRRRGRPLREAASRTRISMTTFHLWEKGEVEPSSEHLRDALAALEYDFYDLQDVLESVETVPEPEPLQPELPEEERLVREIVEDFALLLKLRIGNEEARGEPS